MEEGSVMSMEHNSPESSYVSPTDLLIPLDFPGGSTEKNLPAKQEIWVQSLGQEDPLKKEIATHSRILAWEISWTEEPGGLQT